MSGTTTSRFVIDVSSSSKESGIPRAVADGNNSGFPIPRKDYADHVAPCWGGSQFYAPVTAGANAPKGKFLHRDKYLASRGLLLSRICLKAGGTRCPVCNFIYAGRRLGETYCVDHAGTWYTSASEL